MNVRERFSHDKENKNPRKSGQRLLQGFELKTGR